MYKTKCYCIIASTAETLPGPSLNLLIKRLTVTCGCWIGTVNTNVPMPLMLGRAAAPPSGFLRKVLHRVQPFSGPACANEQISTANYVQTVSSGPLFANNQASKL